jgi:nucleosome binding factor SPN SPT16 subunit
VNAVVHLEGVRQAGEDVAAGKVAPDADKDALGAKALRRAPLRVELVARDKTDQDAANFAKLVSDIQGSSSGSVLGVLSAEPGEGEFAAGWQAAVKDAGIATTSIEQGIILSTTVKDTSAAENIRKAASLTVAITRKVFNAAFRKAIESDKVTIHDKLAEAIDQAPMTTKPEDLSASLAKLQQDYCDTGLHAVVQSGGKYNIKITTASPDSAKLAPDTILFSYGARYRSYNSIIARTYLINPTKSQGEAYKALHEAHGTLIEGLKEGAVIGSVVRDARRILEKALPSATIPAQLGSGIGVFLDETVLALTEDNDTVVQPGMCFGVVTAFSDAENKESTSGAKGNKGMARFSQVLADTVFVLPKGGVGPNVVLTSKSKAEQTDITYELEEDEEGASDGDEESGDDDDDDDGDMDDEPRRSARIRATAGDAEESAAAREKRAAQLQAIFLKQVSEARAAVERMRGGGNQETALQESVRKSKPIRAYGSLEEFPREARPNRIFVDKDRECVLLPLFGQLVPYHIATIRSVVKSEEGGRTLLRFNFYAPGASAGKDCPPSMISAMEKHPHHMYVRTLSFQAKDGRNLSHVMRVVKEMQKRLRSEALQKREESNLVAQAKLAVNRTGKVPRLQRLNMYPRLSGKKCIGALEAHNNGLRFRSDRGETLDIIYDNIKHAVFQPCQRDLHVIIHFHLIHPIMVGKKKYKDIKFYTEVVEASQALDGARRSVYDPDEIDEEQRERQLRRQLNTAFKTFVQKVEAAAQAEPFPSHLEFDVPSRDLSFMGKVNKEMVEISPCRDALVALSDTPPFVLTLDHVEHVHFERVLYGSKNFDMTFVFKAGVAEPGQDEFVQITMVPMESLELIQNWLVDVVEKTYTQGAAALNWKSLISKFVRADDFYLSHDEDGHRKPVGWLFLGDWSSDEESGAEDGEGGGAKKKKGGGGSDDDEDFEGEESEEEEEDEEDAFDEDDYADEDEEEEDDEEDEFEEEDGEEEAADWDELERRALEDDKRAEELDRQRAKDDGQRARPSKRPRDGDERSAKRMKQR